MEVAAGVARLLLGKEYINLRTSEHNGTDYTVIVCHIQMVINPSFDMVSLYSHNFQNAVETCRHFSGLKGG